MSENQTSFSEYLVSNNVVKVDEMVNAMIQQMKFTPTVSEIVFEEKLMKPEQILSVISHQSRKKTDFITAARELSLWNDELEKRVFKYLDQVQKPLVERLIEDQILTFESLNQHLDSYIGSLTETVTTPELPEATQPVADVSISVSASPEILVFAQMFEETIKIQLLDSVVSGALFSDQSCLEVLRNIGATAEMAGLNRFSTIVSLCVSRIERIHLQGNSEDPLSQKFIQLLRNAIEPLWTYRESIMRNGNDLAFTAENPPMSQLLGLLQSFLETDM